MMVRMKKIDLHNYIQTKFDYLMERCEKRRNDKDFVAYKIPYTPVELVDEILDAVPPIKEKKFDVRIGVFYTIEIAFNLLHRGFTDVIVIVGEQDDVIEESCAKVGAKYKVINIDEEQNMPKFDVTVGNPPYQGNAQLHQRFFNMAVDITKPGGVVGFLQPATPYLNKKDNDVIYKHHELMKENLKQYKVNAWLFNPNLYFTEANIGNILSVTILKKVKDDSTISSLTYDFNGKQQIFNNISLEDITIHGEEPKIVASIKSKIIAWIAHHNSLDDIIGGDVKEYFCRLGQVRGNISGTGSHTLTNNSFFKNDFFTLVTGKINDNVSLWNADNEHEFGIFCNTQEEANNVYGYCTTKFTQFALSLSKFTTNNHRGELKTVPVVDFSIYWTDEKLFELFNLSQPEINFINSFIGDFYDK